MSDIDFDAFDQLDFEQAEKTLNENQQARQAAEDKKIAVLLNDDPNDCSGGACKI